MKYRCTHSFIIGSKQYWKNDLIPYTEYEALPVGYRAFFKVFNNENNAQLIGDIYVTERTI